jgi:hypothetical protein
MSKIKNLEKAWDEFCQKVAPVPGNIRNAYDCCLQNMDTDSCRWLWARIKELQVLDGCLSQIVFAEQNWHLVELEAKFASFVPERYRSIQRRDLIDFESRLPDRKVFAALKVGDNLHLCRSGKEATKIDRQVRRIASIDKDGRKLSIQTENKMSLHVISGESYGWIPMQKNSCWIVATSKPQLAYGKAYYELYGLYKNQ